MSVPLPLNRESLNDRLMSVPVFSSRTAVPLFRKMLLSYWESLTLFPSLELLF